MPDERLEKYAAYADRLAAELDELARLRKQYKKIPIGLVTAPLGWIWGVEWALLIALGWIGLWLVAMYLNRARRWYTTRELAEARRMRDWLATLP